MPACLAHRIGAAVRSRRGVAAIEFGVVMAAVVVIVLGTYDIGNYVLQQMKLADAAHVAGQFLVSYPDDTADMTLAVDAVLPPAWVSDVTVTGPSMTCTCGGAGIGDAPTCSAVCPSGQIERFMTITLTRAYSPLLVPGLTSTNASYVARIQ
jgi:hypothetical protein